MWRMLGSQCKTQIPEDRWVLEKIFKDPRNLLHFSRKQKQIASPAEAGCKKQAFSSKGSLLLASFKDNEM